MTEPPHTPPLVLAKLAFPKTVPLTYEKIFTQVDDATSLQLKKISDARYEVVVACERSFAEAAIKGVQRYLPSLFGLKDAVEQLPPSFAKNLEIKWTSGLRPRYYLRAEKHSSWYFEIINVLLTFGLLHRKQALEKLSAITASSYLTQAKEAINLLAIAAGVFQYISDNVVTKFYVDINELLIPEMFAETFSALSILCLAEQQELLVKQACLKQYPHVVAAKLAMGAYTHYETALNALKNIQKRSPHPKVRIIAQPIEDFFQLKATITETLAYKFMGLHHIDTSRMENGRAEPGIFKPGLAIAYLQRAQKIIGNAINPRETDENLEALLPVVKELKAEVDRLLSEANRDNDSIYHENIQHDAMQQIEPKLMAKFTLFEPPPAAEMNITHKENSILCCIQ